MKKRVSMLHTQCCRIVCDNSPIQFSFTLFSESIKKKPKSKETQPKKAPELHNLIAFIMVSFTKINPTKHR